MSNSVGRARIRLVKALSLSCEGKDAKARNEIHNAVQLLDIVLDDEEILADGGFSSPSLCDHAIERRGPGKAVCSKCDRPADEVVRQ